MDMPFVNVLCVQTSTHRSALLADRACVVTRGLKQVVSVGQYKELCRNSVRVAADWLDLY